MIFGIKEKSIILIHTIDRFSSINLNVVEKLIYLNNSTQIVKLVY